VFALDVLTTLREQYPLADTLIIAALILLITCAVEHNVFRIIERIGHSKSNPLPASSIFANPVFRI